METATPLRQRSRPKPQPRPVLTMPPPLPEVRELPEFVFIPEPPKRGILATMRQALGSWSDTTTDFGQAANAAQRFILAAQKRAEAQAEMALVAQESAFAHEQQGRQVVFEKLVEGEALEFDHEKTVARAYSAAKRVCRWLGTAQGGETEQFAGQAFAAVSETAASAKAKTHRRLQAAEGLMEGRGFFKPGRSAVPLTDTGLSLKRLALEGTVRTGNALLFRQAYEAWQIITQTGGDTWVGAGVLIAGFLAPTILTKAIELTKKGVTDSLAAIRVARQDGAVAGLKELVYRQPVDAKAALRVCLRGSTFLALNTATIAAMSTVLGAPVDASMLAAAGFTSTIFRLAGGGLLSTLGFTSGVETAVAWFRHQKDMVDELTQYLFFQGCGDSQRQQILLSREKSRPDGKGNWFQEKFRNRKGWLEIGEFACGKKDLTPQEALNAARALETSIETTMLLISHNPTRYSRWQIGKGEVVDRRDVLKQMFELEKQLFSLSLRSTWSTVEKDAVLTTLRRRDPRNRTLSLPDLIQTEVEKRRNNQNELLRWAVLTSATLSLPLLKGVSRAKEFVDHTVPLVGQASAAFNEFTFGVHQFGEHLQLRPGWAVAAHDALSGAVSSSLETRNPVIGQRVSYLTALNELLEEVKKDNKKALLAQKSLSAAIRPGGNPDALAADIVLLREKLQKEGVSFSDLDLVVSAAARNRVNDPFLTRLPAEVNAGSPLSQVESTVHMLLSCKDGEIRGNLARMIREHHLEDDLYFSATDGQQMLEKFGASREALGVQLRLLGWDEARVVAAMSSPGRVAVKDGVVIIKELDWVGVPKGARGDVSQIVEIISRSSDADFALATSPQRLTVFNSQTGQFEQDWGLDLGKFLDPNPKVFNRDSALFLVRQALNEAGASDVDRLVNAAASGDLTAFNRIAQVINSQVNNQPLGSFPRARQAWEVLHANNFQANPTNSSYQNVLSHLDGSPDPKRIALERLMFHHESLGLDSPETIAKGVRRAATSPGGTRPSLTDVFRGSTTLHDVLQSQMPSQTTPDANGVTASIQISHGAYSPQVYEMLHAAEGDTMDFHDGTKFVSYLLARNASGQRSGVSTPAIQLVKHLTEPFADPNSNYFNNPVAPISPDKRSYSVEDLLNLAAAAMQAQPPSRMSGFFAQSAQPSPAGNLLTGFLSQTEPTNVAQAVPTRVPLVGVEIPGAAPLKRALEKLDPDGRAAVGHKLEQFLAARALIDIYGPENVETEYLNFAPLGTVRGMPINGFIGGAQVLFGKDADQLSVPQLAVLQRLTQGNAFSGTDESGRTFYVYTEFISNTESKLTTTYNFTEFTTALKRNGKYLISSRLNAPADVKAKYLQEIDGLEIKWQVPPGMEPQAARARAVGKEIVAPGGIVVVDPHQTILEQSPGLSPRIPSRTGAVITQADLDSYWKKVRATERLTNSGWAYEFPATSETGRTARVPAFQQIVTDPANSGKHKLVQNPGIAIFVGDPDGNVVAEINPTNQLDVTVPVGSIEKLPTYAFLKWQYALEGKNFDDFNLPNAPTRFATLSDTPAASALHNPYEALESLSPANSLKPKEALIFSSDVAWQMAMRDYLKTHPDGWRKFQDFCSQFGIEQYNLDGTLAESPAPYAVLGGEDVYVRPQGVVKFTAVVGAPKRFLTDPTQISAFESLREIMTASDAERSVPAPATGRRVFGANDLKFLSSSPAGAPPESVGFKTGTAAMIKGGKVFALGGGTLTMAKVGEDEWVPIFAYTRGQAANITSGGVSVKTLEETVGSSYAYGSQTVAAIAFDLARKTVRHEFTRSASRLVAAAGRP